MPLGTLQRLPRGRRIWESVYAEGLASHGDEQRAARTAWSAVKGAGYYQDAKGVWRSPSTKERKSMSKSNRNRNGDSPQAKSAAARRRGEIDAATLLKRIRKLRDGHTFSVLAERTIAGDRVAPVPVRIRKGAMGNVIAVGDTSGRWYADTLLQRGEVPRALLIDGGSNEAWTNPREVFAAFMLDEVKPKPRSSGKSAGRKSSGKPSSPKPAYKVGQFIRINEDTTAEILAVEPYDRPGGGGFKFTIQQSDVDDPLVFDQNTLRGFEVIRRPAGTRRASSGPSGKFDVYRVTGNDDPKRLGKVFPTGWTRIRLPAGARWAQASDVLIATQHRSPNALRGTTIDLVATLPGRTVVAGQMDHAKSSAKPKGRRKASPQKAIASKVTAAQRKVLERAYKQAVASRQDDRLDPTVVAPSNQARTYVTLASRGLLERPMAMSPAYAITSAGLAALGKELPKKVATSKATALSNMERGILLDLLEDEVEADEDGYGSDYAARDFYRGEADFTSAYKLVNRGYATAVVETPDHIALAITGKGIKAANEAMKSGSARTAWMGQQVSDRAWVPLSETEASIVYESEARTDEKGGDYLEIVKLADSKAGASLDEKRRLIGMGQYEPKWRWFSGRVGNPAPRAPRCAPRGKLTAKMRKSLPSAAFALPRERKYPLYKVAGGRLAPSSSHAANAKARAKQALARGTLSRKDYNRIVKAANRVLAMCGGR